MQEVLSINYAGRYYTRVDMLVAVHEKVEVIKQGNNILITPHIDSDMWGHGIVTNAPYYDDRIFYWNFRGDCVGMYDPKLGFTKDSLSDYDLMKGINPQKLTYDASIEIVDCEQCRDWMKEKKTIRLVPRLEVSQDASKENRE